LGGGGFLGGICSPFCELTSFIYILFVVCLKNKILTNKRILYSNHVTTNSVQYKRYWATIPIQNQTENVQKYKNKENKIKINKQKIKVT
jgi:hypothetical protein